MQDILVKILVNCVAVLLADPTALTSVLGLECVGSCFMAAASGEKLAQTQANPYAAATYL